MTNLTLHIRRATAVDSETMADIHRRSWSAAYADLLPAAVIAEKNAGRSALWKRILQEQPPADVNYFLAEVDGVPAGMIAFGAYRGEAAAGLGEIHAVYLMPEWQHLGIGSQLIAFAITELKKAGYRRAALWVLSTNVNAIRCYEKNGFQPDASKTDDICGTPVTELRYSRELC